MAEDLNFKPAFRPVL